MRLKFELNFIILILLGIAIATQAGTFKPFIRSRYSIRWRKTTEMPKPWDSTTSFGLKEEIEKNSVNPTNGSDNATDEPTHLTTTRTLVKTSTHSTDYDYYNNEVEEGDHKN